MADKKAALALGGDEYNRLQQELIALKTYKYESQEKTKHLEAEMQQLKKLNSAQDNELQKTKKLLDKAQATITKSKEKQALSNLADQIAALQQELQESKEQTQQAIRNVALAEAAAGANKAEVERLKAQLFESKTQQRLTGTDTDQSPHHAEEIARLDLEVQDKITEIQQLQATVDLERREHSKTKQILAEKQVLLNQIQELQALQGNEAKSQEAVLNEQLHAQAAQMSAMKAREQSEVQQLRHLETERDKLAKDLDTSVRSEQYMKDKHARLFSDFEALKSKLEKHDQEMIVLKKDLATARTETHTAKAELAKRIDEIQGKDIEIATLTNSLEDLNEKLRAMESANFPGVIRTLRADLESKQTELQRSRTEIARLESVVAQKSTEIEAQRKAMTDAQSAHAAEVTKYQITTSGLEATLGACRNDLAQEQAKVTQVQAELADTAPLKEQLRQMVEVQVHNKQLRDQVNELLAKVSNLDEQHKQNIKDIETQLQAASLMEKRQAQVVKDLKQELRRITTLQEQLTEERDRLMTEKATAAAAAANDIKQRRPSTGLVSRSSMPSLHRSGGHDERGGDADKVTELELDNARLKERVGMLEESVTQLSDDCQKKTNIIREMLRKGHTFLTDDDFTSTGSQEASSESGSTHSQYLPRHLHDINEKLSKLASRALRTGGKAAKVEAEKQDKMESIMEELLVQNMNLQVFHLVFDSAW
eukprot:c17971_g1_i4.p1 GENE.c17971_g1_i4~~c17971_g1_i4.p1  ORF type:complete len:720 (+),score=198.94 c17971_g1_i4:29-2161(+)